MKEFKFELGDKVECRVTGLTGVIVVKSVHLNGCVRYGVQTQKLKDGKIQDAEWLDEKQVKLVKAGVIQIEQSNTGGPGLVPRQSPNPR